MSCRVLRRGMELAMFDQIIESAQKIGINRIIGYYFPTPKNGMVKYLFNNLEFKQLVSHENGDSTWYFEIPKCYIKKNNIIEVT